MQYFDLEITKLRHRRMIILLSCFYLVSLPLTVNGLANFARTGPEGTYIEEVAYAYFRFTLTYLFLPLWVIVLSGTELRNGHAHRVVFLTSRNHYFLSKIVFCLITGIMFAGIGMVTLAIADIYSPYQFLDIPATFYAGFFLQGFIIFFSYSLFLMSLVFLFRNIVLTYVIYLFWGLVENIIFMIAEKSGTKLIYLPEHLLNGLFVHDGKVELGNYFIVFDQWKNSYLGVVLMLLIMLLTAYKYFTRASFFSLSD